MEKEDETGELDPIVAQLRTIFFLPLPADVSARSGHLRNIFLAFYTTIGSCSFRETAGPVAFGTVYVYEQLHNQVLPFMIHSRTQFVLRGQEKEPFFSNDQTGCDAAKTTRVTQASRAKGKMRSWLARPTWSTTCGTRSTSPA